MGYQAWGTVLAGEREGLALVASPSCWDGALG